MFTTKHDSTLLYLLSLWVLFRTPTWAIIWHKYYINTSWCLLANTSSFFLTNKKLLTCMRISFKYFIFYGGLRIQLGWNWDTLEYLKYIVWFQYTYLVRNLQWNTMAVCRTWSKQNRKSETKYQKKHCQNYFRCGKNARVYFKFSNDLLLCHVCFEYY